MAVKIRCSYCQTESIVLDGAPFKCKAHGCNNTECEVLVSPFPELFVVKNGLSFLHYINEGVGIFKTDPAAAFFIQEDADKAVDWLVQTKQGTHREYFAIKPAAWERGSHITKFDELLRKGETGS
jgi:hypothetical protein